MVNMKRTTLILVQFLSGVVHVLSSPSAAMNDSSSTNASFISSSMSVGDEPLTLNITGSSVLPPSTAGNHLDSDFSNNSSLAETKSSSIAMSLVPSDHVSAEPTQLTLHYDMTVTPLPSLQMTSEANLNLDKTTLLSESSSRPVVTLSSKMAGSTSSLTNISTGIRSFDANQTLNRTTVVQLQTSFVSYAPTTAPIPNTNTATQNLDSLSSLNSVNKSSSIMPTLQSFSSKIIEKSPYIKALDVNTLNLTSIGDLHQRTTIDAGRSTFLPFSVSSSVTEMLGSSVLLNHTASFPNIYREVVSSSKVKGSVDSIPYVTKTAEFESDKSTLAINELYLTMSVLASSSSKPELNFITSSTQLLTNTYYVAVDNSATLNYSDITITSTAPETKYDFNYEIELTGECDLIKQDDVFKEVWAGLLTAIRRESGSDETITPIKLACNPLRLSLKVFNSPRKNLTEILEEKIKKEKINVTVFIDNSAKILQAKRIGFYIDDDYDSDIFLMGLNEVDIIVIICATAISLILVCAGLIICAREYYLKKRTRSFTLSSYASNGSGSYDYTLTKIPRTKGAYTENGVRMKPLCDPDSQKDALLPMDEHETSVSDIHIRMNSNDSGIIVGVTGTGSPNKIVDSPDLSDNCDEAGKKLVDNHEDGDKSVDNPIYFADDDRFANV